MYMYLGYAAYTAQKSYTLVLYILKMNTLPSNTCYGACTYITLVCQSCTEEYTVECYFSQLVTVLSILSQYNL